MNNVQNWELHKMKLKYCCSDEYIINDVTSFALP